MRLSVMRTVVVLMVSGGSGASAEVACPPPTAPGGDGCVLERDEVLAAPLELPAGATLDCRDHELQPAETAVAIGSGVSITRPEIAILIRGVHDVRIQGCRITGFDYGVIFAYSKSNGEDTRNRVIGNRVAANFRAVTLLKTDATDVDGNELIAGAVSVVGIFTDSHDNRVRGNVISGSEGPRLATFLPGVHSGPFFPFHVPQLSGVTLFGAHVFPIYSMFVAGEELQFPSRPEEKVANNLVEGNIIDHPETLAGRLRVGIRADETDGTSIRGNLIARADRGIYLGQNNGSAGGFTFPGSCSDGGTRACVSSVDCLPGESCTGVTSALADFSSTANLVEGNVLAGPFTDSGIHLNLARGTLVRENLVGDSANAGLALERFSLESTEVTENSFRGRLFLNHARAASFGSTVYRNDFTNWGAVSVRTSDGYPFTSLLSFAGEGNYWGLACAAGGFAPATVLTLGGVVNSGVLDDHPLGAPIESGGPACY